MNAHEIIDQVATLNTATRVAIKIRCVCTCRAGMSIDIRETGLPYTKRAQEEE